MKHEKPKRAGEVWVKAEATLGERLKEMPKATGTKGKITERDDAGRLKPGGTKVEPPGSSGAATLAQLGVGKKRSAAAQALASPQERELRAELDRMLLANKNKPITMRLPKAADDA